MPHEDCYDLDATFPQRTCLESGTCLPLVTPVGWLQLTMLVDGISGRHSVYSTASGSPLQAALLPCVYP